MALIFTHDRVKLGQHIGTKKLCAVKLMKDITSIDKLEKFMNEVRLLASCSSSQVVEIQAVSINGTLINSHGQKRTVVYHVTQYAKHGELYRLIKETESFDEKLGRTYFVQLLKGLEYLHSIGISHRDIKPENLLLDHRLTLLLADFGSAARCRTTDGHKAIEFDSAVTVGSQEYNAPEINMEKTYYGEKADLFSAGICLFFFLTGSSPFREATVQDPYFELLSQKDKSNFWSLFSSVNFSAKFRDLFEKITERDVTHRIDIGGIWSHPWIKGEALYDKAELAEAMQQRVEVYTKICMREIQEKIENERWMSKMCMSFIRPPAIEPVISEKPLDNAYKESLEECAMINARLELKNLVVPGLTRADDQVLMPTVADEARKKDEEEDKVGDKEDKEEGKNRVDIVASPDSD